MQKILSLATRAFSLLVVHTRISKVLIFGMLICDFLILPAQILKMPTSPTPIFVVRVCRASILENWSAAKVRSLIIKRYFISLLAQAASAGTTKYLRRCEGIGGQLALGIVMIPYLTDQQGRQCIRSREWRLLASSGHFGSRDPMHEPRQRNFPAIRVPIFIVPGAPFLIHISNFSRNFGSMRRFARLWLHVGETPWPTRIIAAAT